MSVWPADEAVFELVEKVKTKHHSKRLAEANIAVSFVDTNAFVKDRFNWGKTTKFSPAAKVWHAEDKRYDFLITLSTDAWNILNSDQKEALVDLHLSCMQIEYEIDVVEENGKKKPVKDKWGRKVYTDVPKLDADGNPKWKVALLDLNVFQDNVSRYGCWCQDLVDLKSVIKNAESKVVKSAVELEPLENQGLI